MNCLILQPGAVTLSDLAKIYWEEAPVRLDPACHADIERAQPAITTASAGSEAPYGANTGLGKLATATTAPPAPDAITHGPTVRSLSP